MSLLASMHAPAEVSLDERMTWAALSALIGVIHDGPELGTEHEMFQRLEAACQSFRVPAADFDECARLLDYHYMRNGDYYASRNDMAETARIEAIIVALRAGSGTLH